MFYELQDEKNRNQYRKMLSIIGGLSRLFSDDENPYLAYRIHENCFCRYFNAENLSRKDVSADAKIGDLGIGLKTWTGGDDQKIAEFGKLKPKYSHLSGLELAKQISFYRNERIGFTMRTYGINRMIYHIAKRVPGRIEIIEVPFDCIDIDNIRIIRNRGNDNNTYFTDGNHEYHFSTSKNTLYMKFDTSQIIDYFDIEIIDDPFKRLEELFSGKKEEEHFFTFFFNSPVENGDVLKDNQLCLRLYGYKNDRKFVFEKSGLNIWNAGGRPRDPNEIYIPYPKADRDRKPNYFPDIDKTFNLSLPNGKVLNAKICQEDGKAIMTNPNADLGKWLLRDVLGLKENELVTYDKLQLFGVDSVIFTKLSDSDYKIDFSPIGSYEKYYCDEEEMED